MHVLNFNQLHHDSLINKYVGNLQREPDCANDE
jgi:hypothetical protein